MYGVGLSRLHDLGPRCGGSVVPNGDRLYTLHLPGGFIDAFVSHRSDMFTCGPGRCLAGEGAMTVGRAADDEGHSSGKALCRGVGRKSALKKVTTGCRMSVDRLHGLGNVGNGGVETKGDLQVE